VDGRLVDIYAAIVSHFRTKEFLDEVYTHSARQEVEDTTLGYALYQSGVFDCEID